MQAPHLDPVLTWDMNVLTDKCVKGTTANEERCKEMVYNSLGIATASLPDIGHMKCTIDADGAAGQLELNLMEHTIICKLFIPIRV